VPGVVTAPFNMPKHFFYPISAPVHHHMSTIPC